MNFFEKISAGFPVDNIRFRTNTSAQWFINNLRNMRINTQELVRTQGTQRPSSPGDIIGSLFMFYYDPKTKEKLPFYDSFPLAIPFSVQTNGFTGINLHYLPPEVRARVFLELLSVASNARFDETTKLRLTYRKLQSITQSRIIQFCIKRYLFSHLRSRTVKITASDWETAVFLPTERFKKLSAEQVWSKL